MHPPPPTLHDNPDRSFDGMDPQNACKAVKIGPKQMENVTIIPVVDVWWRYNHRMDLACSAGLLAPIKLSVSILRAFIQWNTVVLKWKGAYCVLDDHLKWGFLLCLRLQPGPKWFSNKHYNVVRLECLKRVFCGFHVTGQLNHTLFKYWAENNPPQFVNVSIACKHHVPLPSECHLSARWNISTTSGDRTML